MGDFLKKVGKIFADFLDHFLKKQHSIKDLSKWAKSGHFEIYTRQTGCEMRPQQSVPLKQMMMSTYLWTFMAYFHIFVLILVTRMSVCLFTSTRSCSFQYSYFDSVWVFDREIGKYWNTVITPTLQCDPIGQFLISSWQHKSSPKYLLTFGAILKNTTF